jgi:cysteine desulfurase
MLDVERWMLKAEPSEVLYFDHNATHPLSDAARHAWLEAVERFPANPSSPHRLGQRAEAALDVARERLGHLLGTPAERIVFTSGATEANNTVLRRFEEVWVSAIEHPCVLQTTTQPGSHIPVQANGVLDFDWLSDELNRDHPELVAVMAANNETGVLQPWTEVRDLCKTHGVPFLCDAAQWIGKLPAHELGHADFVTGCAHKFGGPQGVGFLVCSRHFPPLLRGGPQEDGRRAGTENVAGILSMVAALEDCATTIRANATQEREAWRKEFERELLEAVPEIQILGQDAPRLWNTVAVLMPEPPDCRRRWVVVMDKLGFAVSTGSACASGKEKPSHVLTAMGIPPGHAGRALRFSAGWRTTEGDWKKLLGGVKAAVGEMAEGK